MLPRDNIWGGTGPICLYKRSLPTPRVLENGIEKRFPVHLLFFLPGVWLRPVQMLSPSRRKPMPRHHTLALLPSSGSLLSCIQLSKCLIFYKAHPPSSSNSDISFSDKCLAGGHVQKLDYGSRRKDVGWHWACSQAEMSAFHCVHRY
jgi:hypothetical protein